MSTGKLPDFPIPANAVTSGITAQVPSPTIPEDVPGPIVGTIMTPDFAKMIGRLAYVWGWTMVNIHNRRAAFAMAPTRGLLGGVLPIAPVGYNTMLTDYVKPEETFVTCPNQDVVYGAGFCELDKEPQIFQVPDFGDRFWVYALYDARTDQIARIGQQYGTKPGFYMVVGPGFSGGTPEGVTAILKSPTELMFSVPRVFKEDTAEDTEAVQALLSQVLFYPLSEFDGTIKTHDWSTLPTFPAPSTAGHGETQWVQPENFDERLQAVMKLVPPLPGEESLYGLINSVLATAETDPEIKQALIETFVAADKELIAPLLQWKNNGLHIGNGWNSMVNASEWGTDYLSRVAVAKSSMFSNTPNETKYFYRDFDNTGSNSPARTSTR